MPSFHRSAAEFAVNSFTAANQTAPSVATFADGGFVIVWGSLDTAQDGSESAIKGQRFDSSGAKVGAEFLVNSAATGSQFTASVATLADGKFIVTWVTTDPTQDGSSNAIKARLFGHDGSPLGSEFLVNTVATSSQFTPNAAALAGGGFVISWDDWSSFDVKAQIFNASGSRVGGEFRVNTLTDYAQEYGDITGLAGGGFVATWRTTDPSGDGSDQSVKAQVFDASGAKVGGEFLVNSFKTGYQYDPTIAALSNGGFVITWYTTDAAQDAGGGAVKGQVFSASGSRVGGEFLVNTQGFDTQKEAVVTATPDGGFVVAWTTFDAAQDGSSFAVKAQAFDSSGAKLGGEILVNSLATGAQFLPDIATLADGRVIVTWTSESGDGNGYAVRARILDPNAAPRIVSDGGGTSASFTLDEGQTAVTSVAATDSDGPGPVRYAIAGGADAGLFAIDPVTGALRLIAAPDYEAPADFGADNFYTVVVSASDGELSTRQSISVLVRNVNEGVAITSGGGGDSAAVTVAENQSAATVVAAKDVDGDPVRYAIAGGADAALFAIDPQSGELRFVQAPNFEAPADSDGDNVYEVVVSAGDGTFSDSQAVSVRVGNVNEGVAITSGGGGDSAAVTVAENQSAATVVAAKDLDGDPVRYAIAGGADAALFAIDPQTGELRFVQAPNFEAPADSDGDNVYEVVVSAGDGTFSDSQAVSVRVGNVNEGVAITSGGGADSAAVTVAENQSAATVVAAKDLDGDPVRYAIAGGADAALFAIDPQSGQLRFVQAPNFEAPADSDGDNVYEVVVSAGDGTFSDSQAVSVRVGNVDEAVAIVSNGGADLQLTVGENGRDVTTVFAVDPEGSAPVYSIVGGADSSRFTIDPASGVLRFVSAPDYEAPGDSDGDNVYAVVVAASDGTSVDTQAVRVAVGNVDEGVDLVSYGGADTVFLTIAENGSAAAQVAARDRDGDPVTYTIAGGADAALFTIDPSTGALKFVAPPNFEAPADSNGDNVYKVEVAAAAGAFSAVQAFAVTVANVHEGVAITSNGGGASAAVAVNENGRAVTYVAATADADGAVFTYSIVGGADAARFTIDPRTGALQFVTAPDFEAPADADRNNVYSVVVQAGDGAFSDTQALSVTVLNVRDGVTISGTTRNDWITDSNVNPALRTTNAEDVVYGRGGHDTIEGLGGDDWLYGEAGNDTLTGGAGADRLSGGAGKDEFVYNGVSDSTPGARDVITDFSRSEGDRISLTGIDANSLLGGDQAFTFIGASAFSHVAGQLRFEWSGGTTLVSGDVNGDGVADFQIELSGQFTPVASDFFL